MYDKELIEEIRQRADIVTVISAYLNVIKKGRGYVAVCPFHDDSDPSLTISPERQTFHCFVDGHMGNVFAFVMQYEHVSFPEAVKKVAEIINFDDPRLHEKVFVKKEDASLTPIIKCINDLNSFYEYNLGTDEGSAGREYLSKRNIDNEMIKKFHVGYAPKDGTKTINYLKAKGHSIKTIEETGIALTKSSNMSDNNAGRLIFPIHDNGGQVVGFSARRLDDSDKSVAKYVNSPETKLFKKGKVLYNFYNAKDFAKIDKYLYILEGFMDVFALEKAGIHSACAVMGTALTKDHITSLRRLNVEIRMCLDGDEAGQSNMMKIVPELQKAGIDVRVVSHPGDLRDPDDILQEEGVESLRNYLNALVSPFDFAVNYHKSTKPFQTVEEKKRFIAEFMPLLTTTHSQIEFDNYAYKLSSATGIDVRAIKDAAVRARKKASDQIQEKVTIEDISKQGYAFNEEKKELRRINMAEKEILYHMFFNKDAAKFYEENVEYFYIPIYRELANFILDYELKHDELDISGLLTDIQTSESTKKDELEKLAMAITEEKGHLPYSEKLMKEHYEAIKQERDKINKAERIKHTLDGKTDEEKLRILKDTIKRVD